jgi:hypothetical protein
MNERLKQQLWELYNEFCIKGVMIISRENWELEIYRISAQFTEEAGK